MLSGFTYTSPHAAWDPSVSITDLDDTEMEAQNIDSLGNAGYSRSFLEGLHDSVRTHVTRLLSKWRSVLTSRSLIQSRRLSRGIDTAARELLGRIRRLVRSR